MKKTLSLIYSFCEDALHLWPVGPKKPLGYVCESLVEGENWKPRALEFTFRALGLETKIMNDPNTIHGNVDTIYVYHREALAKLLRANEGVLNRYGWTTDPLDFIKNVNKYAARPKTDLFDLIANAFADYKNKMAYR